MKLLSEHVFGQGPAVVRHHQMANGLELLLVRDPSAPVIAYQTWFRVGSRHEREGITGIAHLFEHLMFNQTESLAPGEFDRLLESAGGETNAATWVDWTYYRNNLPKAALDLVIKLEADRMAHLVLGETQVESEREVVANERRFRVEDDVDGFLSEELYKMAFSVHSYHWPTIGWMKDILAISIDDCRTFYRTYYAPNNATLVVIGDVEESELLEKLERAYGGISAFEIPPENIPAEPPQKSAQRASWPKPTAADKLRMGYRAPAMGDKDFWPFEVLSEILAGGRSSRLERLLVSEGEIATTVSASIVPFRDPGLFEIAVNMKRGHEAGQAEDIVVRELNSLVQQSWSDAELDVAKIRLKTRFWRDLKSHAGRAEALGHYHTTSGDYRNLFDVVAKVEAVTATDVKRVVKQYLSPECCTIVLATPSGENEMEVEA